MAPISLPQKNIGKIFRWVCGEKIVTFSPHIRKSLIFFPARMWHLKCQWNKIKRVTVLETLSQTQILNFNNSSRRINCHHFFCCVFVFKHIIILFMIGSNSENDMECEKWLQVIQTIDKQLRGKWLKKFLEIEVIALH